MATLFPFPSSKARIRAMSSANWSEVPGGKGVAPIVSKLETIAYPTLLFSIQTKLLHQCTRFPQNWSEDLLTILLGVLPNGPKFKVGGDRIFHEDRNIDALKSISELLHRKRIRRRPRANP